MRIIPFSFAGLSLACLALLIGGHAQAADIPQSSGRDSRIQHVSYHPDDVVVVRAAVGIVSRIVFAPDESVLTIHSGYVAGWDVEPLGRSLTIKALTDNGVRPNALDWATNLTVQTNLRFYNFELLLAKQTDSDVFYQIKFSYPTQEMIALLAQREREAKAEREAQALAVRSSPRGLHYSMRIGKHGQRIVPTMVYDDGTHTYMRFPDTREYPVAYAITADGFEYNADGKVLDEPPHLLKIPGVHDQINLRLGKAVVSIHKQGNEL